MLATACFSLTILSAVVILGDEPEQGPEVQTVPPRVLARVDGGEITDEDVRLAILMQLPEGDPRRDSQVVRRTALFTLVQRALANESFAEGVAPNEAEIDLEVERRRKAFAAVERSWADELRRERISEPAARKLLAWRIGWSRYLDRTLNEANFEKYFDRFRWRFDGGRRRVSHLLLKADDDPQERQRLRVEAEAIRERIAAGETTFEQAVRERSQAESAVDGGELGWIAADGPMPDSFTRVAFRLAAGEIGPPVETPFGIHLVRCEEVEAGTKTYQDVREEVADFAREDLFRWIVEKRLATAQVEFVGNETREEFERSLTPSLLGEKTP